MTKKNTAAAAGAGLGADAGAGSIGGAEGAEDGDSSLGTAETAGSGWDDARPDDWCANTNIDVAAGAAAETGPLNDAAQKRPAMPESSLC